MLKLEAEILKIKEERASYRLRIEEMEMEIKKRLPVGIFVSEKEMSSLRQEDEELDKKIKAQQAQLESGRQCLKEVQDVRESLVDDLAQLDLTSLKVTE